MVSGWRVVGRVLVGVCSEGDGTMTKKADKTRELFGGKVVVMMDGDIADEQVDNFAKALESTTARKLGGEPKKRAKRQVTK
jgi:ATP-dependent protease HslVU (ClpYQ) peptidase subunit